MVDWGSRTRVGSIEVDYQTELQHLVTRVFIQVCHDRFLPAGHGFIGRLRVESAASHRGCRGCAATRRRGEWTRECPTHGKVAREVRESLSAGFGSEASELMLRAKALESEQGIGRGRASFA